MSVVENVVKSIKSRALVPSGSYIAEVAKQPKPRAITRRGRQGVGLLLKITEGEFAGRVVPVDLLTKGEPNDLRVNYDVDVLTAWFDLLGSPAAPRLTELIEKLRQAAEGKRLQFTLQRQTWGGGLELQLTSVRIAP
jgi:hypothetical protein